MSRSPKRREPLRGGSTSDTIQQRTRKDSTAGRASVLVDKRPGVIVVFSVCDSRAAAELLASKLAAVGLAARVAPALRSDCAGAQRRSR